jgi:hypothetical protein
MNKSYLSKTLRFSFIAVTLMTPMWAININFDDQSTSGGAVQLSNQYASSGVLFNNIYAAQSFVSNIFPPSAPNYASPFWVDLNPGSIIFVDPANSSIDATVDSVSFTLVGLTADTLHPGNFSGATIEALDLNGNAIAGQTMVIPGTDVSTANQILTFTGAIHELEFIQTAGNLTNTPEPASLGLFTAGASLLLIRRMLGRKRGRL